VFSIEADGTLDRSGTYGGGHSIPNLGSQFGSEALPLGGLTHKKTKEFFRTLPFYNTGCIQKLGLIQNANHGNLQPPTTNQQNLQAEASLIEN
jgi:hypothetical protein